jgi:coenzyme F420-0:L-glutamate ligase/coenzyme F420-1:gamma-L-glutamate ligase
MTRVSATPPSAAAVQVFAPTGAGEIIAGTDLGALVVDLCSTAGVGLLDGDVVVVTSKAVSKAEGRVGPWDREAAIEAETVRVVARRPGTAIVESRLGLIHAAAGVDDSGVPVGEIALLPLDPDSTAAGIRAAIATRTGVRVGVLISDTAGRPWRQGQTDLAIGAAGMRVLEDHRGRIDGYGYQLKVTEIAVADELCAAAELASGKLGRRPVVVIRGRADLVVEGAGEPATALLRPPTEDWFGYGAREAVVAALSAAEPRAFGAPAALEDLRSALADVLGPMSDIWLDPGMDAEPDTGAAVDGWSIPCTSIEAVAIRAVARAHGWSAEEGPDGLLLRKPGPVP